jgi:hypothetical protein
LGFLLKYRSDKLLSAFLLAKMAVTGTGAALTLAPWVLF